MRPVFIMALLLALSLSPSDPRVASAYCPTLSTSIAHTTGLS